MAGEKQDLRFDLIARDRASTEFTKVGDAAERARRKVEDFNEAGADGETANDRLTKGLRKAAGMAASFTVGAARMAGAVASVGSLALTAAPAVAGAAVAVGQFAAAVAPAAAALAPLAAGLVFTKLVLKGFGPAFTTALEPVKGAFDRAAESSGRLATKGLRPIAREFVKVNFPAVRDAMDRIGRSTNFVATGFGKWLNSAAGVRVIRTLSGDTATAFERLAPAARGVVQSLIAMAGRVSGVSFRAFGDGAEFALFKLNGFIDRIDAGDVQGAITRIKSAAQAAGGALRKIGDALAWVQANWSAIERVRTALAGLAIVVGIATGGWLIALGGALSLLVIHWDKITGAVSRARAWFVNLYKTTPSVRKAVDDVKAGVQRFTNGVRGFLTNAGPGFRKFLSGLQVAIVAVIPYVGRLAKWAGTLAQWWLPKLGKIVGAILAFQGAWYRMVGRVLDAGRRLWSGIKRVFANPGAYFSGIGRAIVQGLVRGLVPGPVIDAAKRIANSLPEWAQKVLRISSPSKVFIRIGENVTWGFAKGINARHDALKNAATRMGQVLQGQVERATAKVQDLVKARLDFMGSTKESLVGGTSIANIQAAEGKRLSSDDVIKQAQKRYKALRTFAINMAKLRKLGLNRTMLADLLEAGADGGGQQAAAVAAGGKNAVKQLNKVQGQISRTAGGTAAAFSHHWHDAGINAARGMLAGLKSQRAQLLGIAARLGKDIAAAVRKALKIKSPSEVFRDIGANTVLGMARGIDDNTAALTGRMTAVASPATLTPRRLGGGTVVYEMHFHGTIATDPDRLAGAVADAFRRRTAGGPRLPRAAVAAH